MKEKQKARVIAVIAVVGLVLISLLAVLLFGSQNKNTNNNSTDSTTGTYMPDSALPTPTNPRPNEPEYESPYDPNENYCRTMVPVYQSELNALNMRITSPSYPDTTYLAQINVEDVITISLDKQPESIDISKLSIAGYWHTDFPDPYITPVENLPTPLFTSNFFEKDGRYNTQFMVGYDKGFTKFIDMIFIYDNQIIFHTMFYTIQGNGTSDMYWDYFYPGTPIGRFTITCGEDVNTYCFFDEDEATLLDWINEVTNVDDWESHGNYINDENEVWFITGEQCKTPLKDGMNFVATQENPSKPEPFLFDSENPDYLVHYIGATQTDVTKKFGEPISIDTLGSTKKYTYEQAAFYISNDTVVQIDVLNETAIPVNGLNATPVNSSALENQIQQLGITKPDYKRITDTPSSYYCVKLPFTHENWTVCYVWESKEQFEPSETNFTKIVIYSGEDYYY